MVKGLGSKIHPFSIVVGVVIGVVISHIARSAVDNVWNMVPFLNTIKANHAYAYY